MPTAVTFSLVTLRSTTVSAALPVTLSSSAVPVPPVMVEALLSRSSRPSSPLGTSKTLR